MISVGAFGEGPRETIDLLTRLARVQVARRRLDVRVSHRSLNVGHRHTAGREQRSVGVAQVVEPQRAQPGRVASAMNRRRSADSSSAPPAPVAEHELVRRGEVAALAQPLQRRGGLRNERDVSDAPPLVPDSTPADSARETVRTSSPTSLQRNARSSPWRSPV